MESAPPSVFSPNRGSDPGTSSTSEIAIFGDQIPAHHVAERLILAHAVHVDRDALRRAKQRRSGVAAEIHVGLERVALHFVEIHAVQLPVHEIPKLERAAVLDIGRGRRLDGTRDLVSREIRSSERRRRDHIHFGSLTTSAIVTVREMGVADCTSICTDWVTNPVLEISSR